METNEVTVSGNFRAIWDIRHETVTKDNILERIHPDDIHIRDAAWRNMDDEGKVSYEIRIIADDHQLKWLRINGTIIKNSEGEPAVMVGIVQDITGEKQSEQHLSELVQQRTLQLQRSNDDLIQFSNIVSHDLKEPVRKIKIFTQMLERASSNEQKNNYLQKIEATTGRMALLIDGILNYSGIHASGFPVERVSLSSIMLSIKKDLELLIEEKRAIFVEQQLPEVQGSRILIQRLFFNLISNALKFSRADRPPRVSISSIIVEKDAQSYVRIKIEDNGIGIDPAFTSRIFEAFERLHPKERFEGSGLGLALCRKIVERHNGTIEAVGKEDGAEFAIELPMEQKIDFV